MYKTCLNKKEPLRVKRFFCFLNQIPAMVRRRKGQSNGVPQAAEGLNKCLKRGSKNAVRVFTAPFSIALLRGCMKNFFNNRSR